MNIPSVKSASRKFCMVCSLNLISHVLLIIVIIAAMGIKPHLPSVREFWVDLETDEEGRM